MEQTKKPNKGAPSLTRVEALEMRLKRESQKLYEARGTINKQNRTIEGLRSTITDLNSKLEKAKATIWEQSKRLGPTDQLEAENQRLAKRVATLESEVSSLKRAGNSSQAQAIATRYLEAQEECHRLQAKLREYEREYGVKS